MSNVLVQLIHQRLDFFLYLLAIVHKALRLHLFEEALRIFDQLGCVLLEIVTYCFGFEIWFELL